MVEVFVGGAEGVPAEGCWTGCPRPGFVGTFDPIRGVGGPATGVELGLAGCRGFGRVVKGFEDF